MRARDLALRWERKSDGRVEADRAILLGSSRVGKSFLAARLIRWFQDDFCDPRIPIVPADRRRGVGRGRILIADNKPRWRATHAAVGPSIRKRYENFVAGDTIASGILDDLRHWELVFDEHINGRQTVIVQAVDKPEEFGVWLGQGAIARFFDTQKPWRPSLVYVDEGLDYFGPTGLGRFGSAIQRSYRAGGEKGIVSVLGSQRPTQISPQTKTETNVHFIFRLNSRKDFRALVDDLGLEAPPYELGPADKRQFWAFRDGELLNRSGRPFTLSA
jgi:hypothetical protein